MKKARTLLVALLAAGLVVALAAAPAASAAGGGDGKAKAAKTSGKARSSQAPRKLNNRIKRVNRTLRSARRRLNSTRRSLRSLTRDLGGLSERLKNGEASLALLIGAAPQLISGLQSLAAAVQTQIAPNLTALGNAVQNEIAPGLKTLGDAYQAVEYGRAGIFATNATVAAGGVQTSADIPDDGNPISVTGKALLVTGAGGATTVDLTAAIRSAEADGDTAAETAGQAGGFVYVTNDSGSRVPCIGAPNPPGILGTVAGATIVTPDGPVTNLPLVNIPGGVLRTDQTQPTAASTSLLPAQCTFVAGGAGEVYEVHYDVNFLDIPTSTTPGAQD